MAEESGTVKPPEGRTVIDAVADLLQTLVDWLRQEAEAIVREKVVVPLQKLGLTIAAASAAASLFVVGMCFIAVGALLLLAQWLTWPGALLSIGGVFVLGATAFTVLKMKTMQR